MSKPKIIISDTYHKRLTEMEDFVFESSEESLAAVDFFLTEHDRVLDFIKSNPTTPALIDNRMSNLKIYPNNSLPTYHED